MVDFSGNPCPGFERNSGGFHYKFIREQIGVKRLREFEGNTLLKTDKPARKRILFLTLLFAFLSCAITEPTCADDAETSSDAAKGQPNIVLILSDDQAWSDYGFMGHKVVQTPNIDKLAKQSVVFRRGYVPTALCRPSLMTLVTGRYAHQHRVTGNDPSPKYAAKGTQEDRVRREKLISYIDQFDTLPGLLADQGYLCHQSGKWWEGHYKRGGFTHGMTRGFPGEGGRHGDDGLTIGRKGLQPVTDFIDMAIEKEKPFFVWYAPLLPHTPHNPPQRLLKKYSSAQRPERIAKYYAMCQWFDETCGELIQHLEKTNTRDNTLIVYVCDNGWIQNPDKNGFALRSKQSAYEGGVRTPIMFCWPNKFPPADRPELCSSIDILPTVIGSCGGKAADDLPGLDLSANLESGAPIERDAIFGEGFAHDIADIENPEASLLYRWCIEGKWKLLLTYDGEVNRAAHVHPRDEKRPQLFDLTTDPTEQQNLAGENPETVAELVKRIEAWYPVEQRATVTRFK